MCKVCDEFIKTVQVARFFKEREVELSYGKNKLKYQDILGVPTFMLKKNGGRGKYGDIFIINKCPNCQADLLERLSISEKPNKSKKLIEMSLLEIKEVFSNSNIKELQDSVAEIDHLISVFEYCQSVLERRNNND